MTTSSAREPALDDEPGSPEIQSVVRVGVVMSLFGPTTPELTAIDVAERTGLNRTTAYRYCVSLVSAGFLEHGSRRGAFRLGDLTLRLGLAAVGTRQVVDLAQPLLAHLTEATRTTSVLSLWHRTGPVVAGVHQDDRETVIVTVNPGTQLGLDAAPTRVFLAFLTDGSAIERLVADLSPTARSRFGAELAQIRVTGFGVGRQDSGFRDAAAPVFDRQGICATIGLVGTSTAIDVSDRSSQRSSLLNAAKTLSHEVGGAFPDA